MYSLTVAAEQVLLQLGDWAACVPLIKRMLHKDAQHPRALSLLAFLTAKPAQQGEQSSCILHAICMFVCPEEQLVDCHCAR